MIGLIGAVALGVVLLDGAVVPLKILHPLFIFDFVVIFAVLFLQKKKNIKCRLCLYLLNRIQINQRFALYFFQRTSNKPRSSVAKSLGAEKTIASETTKNKTGK